MSARKLPSLKGMHFMRCFAPLLSFLCAFRLLAFGSVSGADDRAQDMICKGIIADWQQREASAKTLVATWSRSEVIVSTALKEIGASSASTSERIADKQMPRSAARLVLDGNKLRVERDIPTFADSASGRPRAYISVFDGKENRSFTPKSGNSMAQGVIQPNSQEDFANLETLGLLLVFRPMHSRVTGIAQRKCEIDTSHEIIAGCECTGLRILPSSTADVLRVIWVDEKRNSLPLRMVEYARGVRRAQIDVAYVQSGDGRWLPTSWEGTKLEVNGDVRLASHADEVLVKLNSTVDPSEFTITFPKGTYVSDWRSGAPKAVEDLGDGSVRPWTAERKAVESAWPWWWILNVFVVASLVAALIYQRLSKRRVG